MKLIIYLCWVIKNTINMKNVYENILKILFIAVIILIAAITVKAQKQTDGYIVAVGDQTFVLCTSGEDVTFQSITDVNGRYVYGEVKRFNSYGCYEGTPKEIWSLIERDVQLSALTFPCFVEEIGAGQTPAAKQYYERCMAIRDFLKSL